MIWLMISYEPEKEQIKLSLFVSHSNYCSIEPTSFLFYHCTQPFFFFFEASDDRPELEFPLFHIFYRLEFLFFWFYFFVLESQRPIFYVSKNRQFSGILSNEPNKINEHQYFLSQKSRRSKKNDYHASLWP